MPKAAAEKTAYEILRHALLEAGAHVIREERIETVSPSRLEFWTVPSREKVAPQSPLVIVQVWDRGGGWDAYVPIRNSRTELAVAEVLGK